MVPDFEEIPADAAECAAIDQLLFKGQLKDALEAAEAAQKKYKSSGDAKGEAASLRAVCRVHCAGKAATKDIAKAALTAAEEAVALSKKASYAAGEAAGLRQVAKAYLLSKDAQEAAKAAETALVKHQANASQAGEASALVTLAYVHLKSERQSKALELAEVGMEMFKKLGNECGEAMALQAVVDVNIALKKYSAALQAAERTIDVFHAKKNDLGEGIGKLLAAEVHLAGDDNADAAEAARDAANLFKKAGDTKKMAKALQVGAEATLSEESADEAMSMAERASMIFQQAGDKAGQAGALVTLANLCSAVGDFGKATYRAEAAAEMYKKLGLTSDAAAALRTAALVFLDKLQFDPNAGEGAARDAVRTVSSSLKLYEEAGEKETAGYAGSLQTLASAYFASKELDKAMQNATEARTLFDKLEHPVGAASALNIVAQVHHKKGDTFDAVSAAKSAEQLFKDGGDDNGAAVSEYLIQTFEAAPDKDKEDEKADEAEEEKKKEKVKKPTFIESVSNLPNLIPGKPGAVTIMIAYDAYEGRAATTPGQRRQASDQAGGAAGIEDSFKAPVQNQAIFSLRWLPAQPKPEADEPKSKRAGRRIANKVVRMDMHTGTEAAPQGVVPSAERPGVGLYTNKVRDLTALD